MCPSQLVSQTLNKSYKDSTAKESAAKKRPDLVRSGRKMLASTIEF